MLSLSEEEMKMKRIRKTMRKEKDEWTQIMKQMDEAFCLEGFRWMYLKDRTVGTPQMKEQWDQVSNDLRERTDRALISDPVREWMKLIPEYVAQWDWYTRRMEESRAPIIEQWEVLGPILTKMSPPRNYKPNRPVHWTPTIPEQIIVEIWSLDENLKTVSARYEVIWEDDWNKEELEGWLMRRWIEAAQNKRKGKLTFFSPLHTVNTAETDYDRKTVDIPSIRIYDRRIGRADWKVDHKDVSTNERTERKSRIDGG
jgi:hypothetical protein